MSKFAPGTRIRKVRGSSDDVIPVGATATAVAARSELLGRDDLPVETDQPYEDMFGRSRTYWHSNSEKWEEIRDDRREEKGSWDEIEKATGWTHKQPAHAS